MVLISYGLIETMTGRFDDIGNNVPAMSMSLEGTMNTLYTYYCTILIFALKQSSLFS